MYNNSISALSACACMYVCNFYAASVTVVIGNNITSTYHAGEKKYFNYKFPSAIQGITIKLNTSESGSGLLYLSTLIQTPNEAIYDVKMFSENGLLKEFYVDPSQLVFNGQYIAYISVTAFHDETTITIETTVGDTVLVRKFNFKNPLYKIGCNNRLAQSLTCMCIKSVLKMNEYAFMDEYPGGFMMTLVNLNTLNMRVFHGTTSKTCIQYILSQTRL